MVLLCVLLGGKHEMFVSAREAFLDSLKQSRAELEAMDGLELLGYYTDEDPQDFEEQLRIELPDGVDASDIDIESDIKAAEITISIPTGDEDYFYDYPIVGKSDHITNLAISADGESATLELELDAVYETQIRSEGHYAYIDIAPPSEIYDRILVVDIGHGGNDPGAYISGSYEKTLNLQIGLKLKELLDEQDDIKVYYTRTADESVSLAERVALANDVGADLFLSIHNNMVYDSSDTNGTQVMYNGDDAGDFSSKDFANVCLRCLLEALGSTDKGLIDGDDIYIIRKAKMPVALVEIGFMTNTDELEKLEDEKYQRKAAQALYDAVCESFENLT